MLIVGLKDIKTERGREKRADEILRIFDRDVVLRKKKDLIKKFIEENLPSLTTGANVETAFTEFWNSERYEVLNKIAEEENIPVKNLENLIGDYLYTQKFPRDQVIANQLPNLRILERETVINRIKKAIQEIVEKFEW